MTDTDDDDLDISWIQNETQLQTLQHNYMREPMESIHGIFLYINQNNYIEKIVREMITLTPNDSGKISGSHITSNAVLKIIQAKKLRSPVSKYKFTNMFTHIVDIEPDKVQSFSNTTPEELGKSTFFKETSITDTIHVPPSIFIFHASNTIYFFFQEILVDKHNQTIKSILKPTIKNKNRELDIKSGNKITKKVRIFDKEDEKKEYKKQIRNRGTRKRRM